MSNLKPLVNNKALYEAVLANVDDLIYIQHRTIERADTLAEVHRAQGSIATLRKLKLLREAVNGG